MKQRSRLAWLGALALILAVPPVASSVGDLGSASVSSERKQNQRLDRHSKLLGKHGRQIKRLRAVSYGVARLFADDKSRLLLTTPKLPAPPNHAMTSATVLFNSKGGEVLRLRGAIRSRKPAGTGGAAAALQVVCAPMGGATCAEGSLDAGVVVCAQQGVNPATGERINFKPVRKVPLGNTSAPTASDQDLAGGTCTLPDGGGRYMVSVTGWWIPELGR